MNNDDIYWKNSQIIELQKTFETLQDSIKQYNLAKEIVNPNLIFNSTLEEIHKQLQPFSADIEAIHKQLQPFLASPVIADINSIQNQILANTDIFKRFKQAVELFQNNTSKYQNIKFSDIELSQKAKTSINNILKEYSIDPSSIENYQSNINFTSKATTKSKFNIYSVISLIVMLMQIFLGASSSSQEKLIEQNKQIIQQEKQLYQQNEKILSSIYELIEIQREELELHKLNLKEQNENPVKPELSIENISENQ